MLRQHFKDKLTKENMATWSLMMGMFFLPFGYDALFKAILDWTHSYWTTDFVFYCLSGSFFICYFYFSGINPIQAISKRVISAINRLANLIR